VCQARYVVTLAAPRVAEVSSLAASRRDIEGKAIEIGNDAGISHSLGLPDSQMIMES
jgi:hypothetical protein